MGILSVVKREAQRTVGVALYLFSCFVIFTTLDLLPMTGILEFDFLPGRW